MSECVPHIMVGAWFRDLDTEIPEALFATHSGGPYASR